jgi:hypothetical protein
MKRILTALILISITSISYSQDIGCRGNGAFTGLSWVIPESSVISQSDEGINCVVDGRGDWLSDKYTEYQSDGSTYQYVNCGNFSSYCVLYLNRPGYGTYQVANIYGYESPQCEGTEPAFYDTSSGTFQCQCEDGFRPEKIDDDAYTCDRPEPPCSIPVYTSSDGTSYCSIPDWYCDEHPNDTINCVGPSDSDGDGIPDVDDNCPHRSNAGQQDSDNDGIGNVCDDNPFIDPTQPSEGWGGDSDGDGIPDDEDTSPTGGTPPQPYDPNTNDSDGDGVPDGSDSDPNDPYVGGGTPGTNPTDSAVTGLYCKQEFGCSGDAVQCAILMFQREEYCTNTEGISDAVEQLALAEDLQNIDDLKEQYDISTYVDDVLNVPETNGTCPPDTELSLFFGTVSFSWSPICQLAGTLRPLLLLLFGFLSTRVIYGVL